jgi:methionyl-tRNA formyltransferase
MRESDWSSDVCSSDLILAGDERSGVTIMLMEEGLDTGPILTQRTVPIRPGTTGAELSQQLSFLGASTLIEILPSYLSGMLAPLTQADGLATYAPLLKKSDGLLDFNQPALALTSEGLLVLDQVQPEGKRGMRGSAFLNGQPGWLS